MTIRTDSRSAWVLLCQRSKDLHFCLLAGLLMFSKPRIKSISLSIHQTTRVYSNIMIMVTPVVRGEVGDYGSTQQEELLVVPLAMMEPRLIRL